MCNLLVPNIRRFDPPTVSSRDNLVNKPVYKTLGILGIVMLASMVLFAAPSAAWATISVTQYDNLSKEYDKLEIQYSELNEKYDSLTEQFKQLRDHNTTRTIQESPNNNSQDNGITNTNILGSIWSIWLYAYSAFRAILDTMQTIHITHRYTRILIVPIFFHIVNSSFGKFCKKVMKYLLFLLNRKKSSYPNKK